VVEIIGPGYSFGEALMFMDKPYIVMAQTLADSLLLHVSKQAVFEGLEHDPDFAKKMLAGLSRRLHGLIVDVESYSLQSGTQRVIGYLLRQDEEQANAAAPYVVTLPTSKAIVASRLNLTPEHFSRILHDLAEAGLIAVDGREVKIADIAKLRNYTG
jgi:CRP-like cAMP-binding protein